MASFSERNELKNPPAFQLEHISDELRNSIWSIIDIFAITKKYHDGSRYFPRLSKEFKSFCDSVWIFFYKEPIDTIPDQANEARKFIRNRFFDFSWHELLDFVEFIIETQPKNSKLLTETLNSCFILENSGYRITESGIVIPITSGTELEAIDQSIGASVAQTPSAEHMRKALELFSKRPNPDFRNSIKESISAVESICSIATGKSKPDLNAALAELERKGKLHGGFKAALNSLYGYTSDAGGIRHASIDFDTSPPTQAECKFVLVTCAAFVNYVKEVSTT